MRPWRANVVTRWFRVSVGPVASLPWPRPAWFDADREPGPVAHQRRPAGARPHRRYLGRPFRHLHRRRSPYERPGPRSRRPWRGEGRPGRRAHAQPARADRGDVRLLQGRLLPRTAQLALHQRRGRLPRGRQRCGRGRHRRGGRAGRAGGRPRRRRGGRDRRRLRVAARRGSARATPPSTSTGTTWRGSSTPRGPPAGPRERCCPTAPSTSWWRRGSPTSRRCPRATPPCTPPRSAMAPASTPWR